MKPGKYKIDIGRTVAYRESEAQVVFQGITPYNFNPDNEKEYTAHFTIEDFDNDICSFSMNKSELYSLSNFINGMINAINSKETEDENN